MIVSDQRSPPLPLTALMKRSRLALSHYYKTRRAITAHRSPRPSSNSFKAELNYLNLATHLLRCPAPESSTHSLSSLPHNPSIPSPGPHNSSSTLPPRTFCTARRSLQPTAQLCVSIFPVCCSQSTLPLTSRKTLRLSYQTSYLTSHSSMHVTTSSKQRLGQLSWPAPKRTIVRSRSGSRNILSSCGRSSRGV